jgi:thymidylate synthase
MMPRTYYPDDAYLELLAQVMRRGRRKEQRAVLTSDGRRPSTCSLFGAQMRFDLQEGFPLLTTRKMSFRIVAEEVAWFLSGSRNARALSDRGVRIWDNWADPDTGDLGPVYGHAWRNYPGDTPGSVDQVVLLGRALCEVARDPHHCLARRLLLTSWHPEWGLDPAQKTPIGCHTLAQFDVHDGRINCHVYMRSADLFLGVPYNIAAYALLTHLFGRLAWLQATDLVFSFGDVHVYDNHETAAWEQLRRHPYNPPVLRLTTACDGPENFAPGQASLAGYASHPALTGEVAV